MAEQQDPFESQASLPWQLRLLSSLIAAYHRLLCATTRWEYVGAEHRDSLDEAARPYICAFWHSRLFLMPMQTRFMERNFLIMISEHKDGEVIARAAAKVGVGARRGSSRNEKKADKQKGGAKALREMIADITRHGWNAGITPDGPRGPRQRVKDGTIQLARLSGVPVLPMSYSTKRAIRFKSWDHFMLPLPFQKGVFAYGEPIAVPKKGGDLEAYRQLLEERLNELTDMADRKLGVELTPPADTGR